MLPSASGHVFKFCVSGLVVDGPEGVGSRFHILSARIHFRRYRGRPVPFSCFALPDIFSAVPSVSGPVFMFCALEHVFGGSGWRRVPFFSCSGSFSTVPSVSGPVFMFCSPELVFGGT
jgi:hypothetical protein